MNATQRRAIDIAIGQARDNLLRAEHQKRCNPTYRSGNGVSIDDMIAGYKKTLAELEEGL